MDRKELLKILERNGGTLTEGKVRISLLREERKIWAETRGYYFYCFEKRGDMFSPYGIDYNRPYEEWPEDIVRSYWNVQSALKNIGVWDSCFSRFKRDKTYGHLRLKQLKTYQDLFHRISFDGLSEIEFVDNRELVKIQKRRIPFFLWTTCGMIPGIDKIPGFFNGNKLIAILEKSILNAGVGCLCIAAVKNRNFSRSDSLAFFPHDYMYPRYSRNCHIKTRGHRTEIYHV